MTTKLGVNGVVQSKLDDVFDLIEAQVIFEQVKVLKIKKFLNKNDRLGLKTAATLKGGFINNELREEIWFKLIGLNSDQLLLKLSQNVIEGNEFYRQVILDVERSLKRFPPSVSEHKRILYQDSLTDMIICILSHNPTLHYYQGYHDICLTFLLVLEPNRALMLANQISISHLKYFMEETMNTTSNLLEIIYLILNEENKELHEHLIQSEVGTIFSLSWVITWFSHVLSDLDDILRIFDFFISSHFLMPIYLTVSILQYKREEIIQIDCDMAAMHKYLSDIPESEKLPFDQLISDSLTLSVKYPPDDMLDLQKQMQYLAINGKSEKTTKHLFNKSAFFLRNNVFSITFVVLVTALIYQFYSEYRK